MWIAIGIPSELPQEMVSAMAIAMAIFCFHYVLFHSLTLCLLYPS